MSERKGLEDQLHRAQRLETIGRLAGGVAHDFNNLLTAIRGYTDLAMDQIEEDHPAWFSLKEAQRASSRAAELVRQLLLFSRKEPMEFVSVNLNQLIQDLLKMIKRLIGEDISVKMELAPDLLPIDADPGNLEQVIMNIIVNARDAMPSGGIITIKTENRDVTKDVSNHIPYARPGKYVAMSITDTGIGMDAETVKHIFDPFFTTKGIGKGTGLGLAVVYGIVSRHKGWITVDSAPGKGSTFTVLLPVSKGGASLETEKEDSLFPTNSKGRMERILVIEDDEPVRNLIASVLRKSGYVVFEAVTGRQALDIFEKENGELDLVFSDFILPDMSGLDLFKELKLKKPDIKVVLGSGYTDDRIDLKSLREKGIPFIQKPYKIKELVKQVRELLDSVI